MKKATNIKYLCLDDAAVMPIGPDEKILQNLASLEMETGADLAMHLITKFGPQLRSLHVFSTPCDNAQDLEAINFRNLTSFSCWHLEIDYVAAILKTAINLRRINCSGILGRNKDAFLSQLIIDKQEFQIH